MSTPQFSEGDQPFPDDRALPVSEAPPTVSPDLSPGPSHNGHGEEASPIAPAVAPTRQDLIPWWEPALVLVSTFLFLAILTPRVITFLSPVTGDEPFYLMTAISIIEDHDINECNNYRQREEARFYPESVVTSRVLPAGWLGWPSAPYPLPPHSAKIAPSSRWCLGSNIKPNYVVPDTTFPLPADGTENELYSKHGLGVSLLVTLPYALGDRALVVYFLNLLGALVAVNVYLLARERTGSSFVALLTWLAFSFTIPILSYSYLIFPELPAALLAVYAFRRISLGRNNTLQLFLVGICIGFMPWLHYRFAPISIGLGLYLLYQLYRQRERAVKARVYEALTVFLPAVVSAVGLISYFYFLYREPFPNAADHAGVSDFAGTVRGAAGAFVDKQWGLLTVSPIFVLALFGLVLMAFRREGRKDLLWLGIIALPYFVLISNYAQWWGEWCPPARYMTSILPLLALPFANALAQMSGARAAIYGFVYALLLVPSYLSSWGFLHQPQWMYNQPVTESQLLTNGLDGLASYLGLTFKPGLDISQALPSFVTPYFAYLKNADLGNTWSGIAWEKSLLPFSVFGAILLLCLGLAWWQWRATRPTPPADLASDGHEETSLPVRTARREAERPAYTTQFSLVPALALAGGSLPWFTGFPSTLGRGLVGLSTQVYAATSQVRRPWTPSDDLDVTPGGSGAEPGPAEEAVQEETPPESWPRLIWRTRPGWMALFALGAAIYGEWLALDLEIGRATAWYALGIILLLVAWTGTGKNWNLALPVRRVPTEEPDDPASDDERAVDRRRGRGLFFVPGAWRFALAAVALAANIYFVAVLSGAGFDSTAGGYGWLASVVLLLVAFLGYRSRPLVFEPGEGTEPANDVWISRGVEIALVVGIVLLAFALRFYRLDDWTMGMHGDEGEAGMDALAIFNGQPVSPFGTGWFGQPNFYYYAIAESMRVFGTGLFGLRFFSAIAGTLMVLPVYGLVRQWFGIRMALIAGFLLAISDVALAFSRMEFSNVTTPLFIATSLFFLFRGMKSGRTVDYILAAYSGMLTLYFYMGGRIAPFLLVAVLGYVFLFLPAVGLVPAFGRARWSGEGAGRPFFRTLAGQFGGLRASLINLALFGAACYCFAAPFLFYYLGDRAEMDSRTQDKLIFNNADLVAVQYGLKHEPLYLGSSGLKLADDAFWPGAIWHQLTTTLSLLTYQEDESGVYTFAAAPVTKPIEAALAILGIAWALWRWRDARMATLSIWFWSTVIVGGVLTIDAPYMARLVGIIPVLAIFAALVLDKLAEAIVQAAGLVVRKAIIWRRRAFVLTGLAVACTLALLTWQNIYDYFVRYQASYPFAVTTGMAVFVRDTNADETKNGRALPQYYSMGGPGIIWGYGVNRFLNYGTGGDDLLNVSDALPITRNGGRDVVFIVWPEYKAYLSVLKDCYPEGKEYPFKYSPDGRGDPLFEVFQVSAEGIAAHRTTSVTYLPANGARIDRTEKGFGTGGSPPAGLTYPAQVMWSGAFVAPAFASYKLHIEATNGARLVIDGKDIGHAERGSAGADVDVILAKGVHTLQLSGELAQSSDAVALEWEAGDSPSVPIATNFLWNGPPGGLEAEVTDPSASPPAPKGESPVIERRVDGFVGFRSTDRIAQVRGPAEVTWRGVLNVAHAGRYRFDVGSSSPSRLQIDGVDLSGTGASNQGSNSGGQIDLKQGRHELVLRYNLSKDPGVVELFWTPPGGVRELLPPDALDPAPAVWTPGTVYKPQPFDLPVGGDNQAQISLKLEKTIAEPGVLDKPRGIGVDGQGRIYVGDRGHNRIVVFGPDGTLLRTWGTAPPAQRKDAPGPGEFADIGDIAISPDGTVFVLDRGGPLIQVFDSEGHFQHAFDERTFSAYNPDGLGVLGDTLYVADTGQNRLLGLKYSGTGTGVKILDGGQATKQLDQPLDVAAVPAGSGNAQSNLFTVDISNRALELSPDGSVVGEWPVQIGGNDGGTRIVALDGGKILLSDPDRGRLILLNPASGDVEYFGEPGGNRDQLGVITGIAPAPGGRLYVVNSDRDYIQVFTLKVPK